jgi:hypothetical protein
MKHRIWLLAIPMAMLAAKAYSGGLIIDWIKSTNSPEIAVSEISNAVSDSSNKVSRILINGTTNDPVAGVVDLGTIAGGGGITLASLVGINPTNGHSIALAVLSGLLTDGGTNWTGALCVVNPYNGHPIFLDVIGGMVMDEN